MFDITKRKLIEYLINIVGTFASQEGTDCFKLIYVAQRYHIVYHNLILNIIPISPIS
jgi:hypothetical protein